MANTPATGNGPFEFTNSQGEQISIPLSAITFDSTGQPIVDPDWSSYTTSDPGKTLLKYAVKEALIKPRPTPSPFPAMVIRAADPGAGGNHITVTVNVQPAPSSPPIADPMFVPFDLLITQTDVFANQTAATIATALAGGGGLVQIVGPVNSSGVPGAQNGPLTGSPPQLQVMGTGSPGGTVFVLGAKRTDPSASLTNVKVEPNVTSPPGSGSETFTLTVTWTKTATGITLATLDSDVQSGLGYEITVAKPGSGAYSVPAAGSTTLSGGAGGTRASAMLYTGF
jgi:hypothetical protein